MRSAAWQTRLWVLESRLRDIEALARGMYVRAIAIGQTIHTDMTLPGQSFSGDYRLTVKGCNGVLLEAVTVSWYRVVSAVETLLGTSDTDADGIAVFSDDPPAVDDFVRARVDAFDNYATSDDVDFISSDAAIVTLDPASGYTCAPTCLPCDDPIGETLYINDPCCFIHIISGVCVEVDIELTQTSPTTWYGFHTTALSTFGGFIDWRYYVSCHGGVFSVRRERYEQSGGATADFGTWPMTALVSCSPLVAEFYTDNSGGTGVAYPRTMTLSDTL